MSTTPIYYDGQKVLIAGAATLWCCLVSDYARSIIFHRHYIGEAEAFLLFMLWGLFLWWLSKRYGQGWTFYWGVFAAVSFAPFADILDDAFGGILGLRG